MLLKCRMKSAIHTLTREVVFIGERRVSLPFYRLRFGHIVAATSIHFLLGWLRGRVWIH